MTDMDPRLKQILEQIKPFGFEFYGYGENAVPLVKAPNGQIVDINVAINFVNNQINNQSSSGSIESGPSMNQNMDSAMSIESSVEKNLEKPKDQQDSNDEGDDSQAKPYVVKHSAPKLDLKRPKKVFYGDGFDPKSFDPNNVRSALRYIEKNSKKSNTKSDKWLALLFEKFVKEQRAGLHRG